MSQGIPDEIRSRIEARLREFEAEDIVRRIWAGDHTVWKPDPTEIADRLGWLRLPETMRPALPELNRLAEDCAGFQRVVWLGMGGSSLAAEVLAKLLGGKRPLTVLDSTHPEAVAAVDNAGDPADTLFVVASKSGATVETLSHFAYFWGKQPAGANFIAITDPGSHLESLARERSFRHVCLAPPDVGGRYSALTHFGLVAAALLGADPAILLDSAAGLMPALQAEPHNNPGVRLGVTMGDSALAGRDKLTLLTDADAEPFGDWAEQLVAESTGKEGKGIVPVVGEPPGRPSIYGPDRLFSRLGTGLEAGLDMPKPSLENLGAEFLRWEFAVAIAGRVLGINPFDQPDVEAAKQAARQILSGQSATPATPSPSDSIGVVRPGDYLSLQAWLPPTLVNRDRLQAVRLRLLNRFHVATTLGFGPRFLHSTGQLYKGGPNTGVFLQVVDEPGLDLLIPDAPYTFRQLLDAQSAGDLQTLLARGRRVSRLTLEQLEAL